MMLDARMLNRPLALLETDAAALLDAIQGGPSAQLVQPERADQRERDYAIAAGVAVVPVCGILSHSAWSWWGDETSYDSIRRCMAHAIGNPDVRAIAMHVNSPGGDVAGCFDLADAIYAMRGEKPIWAILDENAFSAAYALACSADRIIVPRTGATGSIGCIMLHADITSALEKMGVKITTIQFGDRKSDGYQTTPLSGKGLAAVQAMIDTMGEMFVDLVARNRGLTASKVRGTEAGIFLGADGVTLGLADAVMSPDQAFLELVDTLG